MYVLRDFQLLVRVERHSYQGYFSFGKTLPRRELCPGTLYHKSFIAE